jgi:hypothetical protein
MKRYLCALVTTSLVCLLTVRPAIGQEDKEAEESDPPVGQEAESPAEDGEEQDSEGEKGQEEEDKEDGLPDWVKRLKISGLAFGDFYWFASHHNPEIEGQNGFWMRRIYLTFDYNIADDLDFRLRFEANSAGSPLAPPLKMDPFVKDAWIRWSPGDHMLFFGLSSTPTWDDIEKIWGYRDVRKTPLDLYKMGASRDFGLTGRGKIGPGKNIQYYIVVGNGAGTRSETNRGKAAYGAFAFTPGDFFFQVYGDYNNLSGLRGLQQPVRRQLRHRPVLRLVEGRRREGRGTVCPPAAEPRRPRPGRFRAERALPLRRVGAERSAGGPRAVRSHASIAYLPMSPDAPSNLVILGLDVTIVKQFHIIPTFDTVIYDAVGDEEAPDTDFVPRLTFSVAF